MTSEMDEFQCIKLFCFASSYMHALCSCSTWNFSSHFYFQTVSLCHFFLFAILWTESLSSASTVSFGWLNFCKLLLTIFCALWFHFHMNSVHYEVLIEWRLIVILISASTNNGQWATAFVFMTVEIAQRLAAENSQKRENKHLMKLGEKRGPWALLFINLMTGSLIPDESIVAKALFMGIFGKFIQWPRQFYDRR